MAENLKVVKLKVASPALPVRDRSSTKGASAYGKDVMPTAGKRSASNSKSRERPVKGPSGPNAILKPPKTNIVMDKSLENMMNLNKRVSFNENAQPQIPWKPGVNAVIMTKRLSADDETTVDKMSNLQ